MANRTLHLAIHGYMILLRVVLRFALLIPLPKGGSLAGVPPF